jgi:hypothetical protein
MIAVRSGLFTCRQPFVQASSLVKSLEEACRSLQAPAEGSPDATPSPKQKGLPDWALATSGSSAIYPVQSASRSPVRGSSFLRLSSSSFSTQPQLLAVLSSPFSNQLGTLLHAPRPLASQHRKLLHVHATNGHTSSTLIRTSIFLPSVFSAAAGQYPRFSSPIYPCSTNPWVRCPPQSWCRQSTVAPRLG